MYKVKEFEYTGNMQFAAELEAFLNADECYALDSMVQVNLGAEPGYNAQVNVIVTLRRVAYKV